MGAIFAPCGGFAGSFTDFLTPAVKLRGQSVYLTRAMLM